MTDSMLVGRLFSAEQAAAGIIRVFNCRIMEHLITEEITRSDSRHKTKPNYVYVHSIDITHGIQEFRKEVPSYW